MAKIVHKGDVGVTFTVTIMADGAVRDISAATGFELYLYNRDTGTLKTFTATKVGDGTSGQITYTTTSSSDLPEAGYCYLSAGITGGGGFSRITNERERIIVVQHPT